MTVCTQEKLSKTLRVEPGKPYPLGATWDGHGVNFALFSSQATQVDLCLFDADDLSQEKLCVALPCCSQQVWHGYLTGLKPGQVYGYRVHGPYAPEQGLRFNSNKILCDPYAKAFAREAIWDDTLFGYKINGQDQDLILDSRPNTSGSPLSVVIDDQYDWEGDAHPDIPWDETIIYEIHVKGFTKLHPDIPETLRGTYAGLSSEPALAYFKKLGITAVELMPIQFFIDEKHLSEQGMRNYWGYNTLGYFAPALRYASTTDPQGAVMEFKTMVKKLHQAGLEVILDVVYNHTAEGNHLGPTLSFKGIDNSAYYQLTEENPRYYKDMTGCGNTLNMNHPRVMQLVMDSLRYWVEVMHVDGFRFDLATALARDCCGFDKVCGLFDIVQQDPVISRVKLIAEPWSMSQAGYQVGHFPPLWAEWNDKYSRSVKRFWRGEQAQMAEFATRFTGSSDLYHPGSRTPYASINFITAHDGFTLYDLVSYNHKHNEANRENNREGQEDNLSWNCGSEGDTDSSEIIELRERQKRNLMATLLLSLGAPMISGGDEMGRSQKGNNNAYCQDNELSWYDWSSSENERFLAFVRQLIAFRKNTPVLHRHGFFRGEQDETLGIHDIQWFKPDASKMTIPDWHQAASKSFGMLLDGCAIDRTGKDGQKMMGDSLLILFNAGSKEINFQLPKHRSGLDWERLLDTSQPKFDVLAWEERSYTLSSHSMALFHLPCHLSKEKSELIR